LDIGLPIVNGLEAARQIRKHALDKKILFLSENRSAAIAENALSIGASGCVVKAKAATDLVTASKTVLQGKRFVSASLVGHEGGNPTSKHTADKNALVHLPPRNVEIGHEVEFYADDAAFVAGFAGCIEAVLQAGNAVIVIATEPHRSGILERLEADGVNIRTHAEQERFIQLDAHEALSTLMLDDAPDRVHFRKLLDDLIARAAKSRDGEHPRVAICGECAPMLLADGKEGGDNSGRTPVGRRLKSLPRRYSLWIFTKCVPAGGKQPGAGESLRGALSRSWAKTWLLGTA